DYAHTPVAITRLVEEVKKIKYNRLILMIAGIGIRDFNKMPKMAAAIDGQADEVVVTVDQPGHQGPRGNLHQVIRGIGGPRTATARSARWCYGRLSMARPLAGSGHYNRRPPRCTAYAQVQTGSRTAQS
ncbi:hypothetical protein KW811_22720, partial [Enterobacter quasiroggenkampii]|nr:hypothetical protein [Enterobacter quasiroggenkampii]